MSAELDPVETACFEIRESIFKNIKTLNLTPEDLPRFLYLIIYSFSAIIPRDVWWLIKKTKFDPCNKPGCTCEKLPEAVKQLMIESRQRHEQIVKEFQAQQPTG